MTPIGFKVIDNCVSDCSAIIDWLEEQVWQRSSTVGGISEIRTSDSYTFPFLSYALPDYVSSANKAVWQAMNTYALEWDFPFTWVEDVSVQRYKASENQHYDTHQDAGPGITRVLSAVLYLNTVETGGDTFFPAFDFSVKPVEGRVALFPSNFIYAHAANPPRSGIKYAAAYWARH